MQSSPIRRTALRLGLVGLLATVLLLLAAGARPAGAQTSFDERITSFRSEVAVQDDGSVVITETIAYDFGSSTNHHGIERFVPTRVPYDDVKKGYDRVFPLDVLSRRVRPRPTSTRPRPTAATHGSASATRIRP